MEHLIFYVVELMLACWVYHDAKSRGSSSPVFWTIAVFIFFIIFLPLYLIMRPAKPDITITKTAPRLCPHCGKYYEPPVAFCPNCGNKI